PFAESFMVGIILLALLVVIAFVLIGMYNSLVQLRVRCDSAWSDIDVQLKRRHDLIPNLVETVKGYAAHEKGTFENIARFRSQAMQASSPADKAAAENQLTGALKSLFAVAENYPELKASEEFTQLQGSLSQTEDSIQNSRRYYNPVVSDQRHRGHVRIPATPILRSRSGRPRTRRGEVLTPCHELRLRLAVACCCSSALRPSLYRPMRRAGALPIFTTRSLSASPERLWSPSD